MADLLPRVPLGELPAKKAPLMIEIPVNSGGPYLVSGVRQDWTWLSDSKTGTIRSAVRTGPLPEDLFASAVREVMRRGDEYEWENCYPYTETGLCGALEYVTSYGIEPAEVLVPIGNTLQAPQGVTLTESSWIPLNSAVVVPMDRSYLGMVANFGTQFHTVVLHNPSRGMAVLGDWCRP